MNEVNMKKIGMIIGITILGILVAFGLIKTPKSNSDSKEPSTTAKKTTSQKKKPFSSSCCK